MPPKLIHVLDRTVVASVCCWPSSVQGYQSYGQQRSWRLRRRLPSGVRPLGDEADANEAENEILLPRTTSTAPSTTASPVVHSAAPASTAHTLIPWSGSARSRSTSRSGNGVLHPLFPFLSPSYLLSLLQIESSTVGVAFCLQIVTAAGEKSEGAEEAA